jgi:peptidyl-Asp metalloendopeptidase
MQIVAASFALLLLGSGSATTPPPVSAPTPCLFAETDAQPVPGVGLDEVSIRRRAVEVDLDLLLNPAGSVGKGAGSNLLELNLFPDEGVVVEHRSVEAASGGGLVWFGTIVDEPGSDVIFSILDDTVFGSITWGDRLYRVEYAGNGVHWVTLVNESLFASCGTDGSHAVHSPLDRDPGAGHSPDRAGNPDIDILVVYSTAAKNQVGGTTAMNNKINLAITETNQAYANSLVDQRLVLVHTEEMIGYTESSSMSTMLTQLRSKTDGNMDDAHLLRDQYGADAVVMICRNNQYCGIAYLMVNVSASFQSSAFSVVSYSCATGYYSFGHELGHNFGCAHDPDNAGAAAYNYSYGFRTSNNQYRTVMAYAPGTRKKYFSSPNVTYNGWVMGAALQDNGRSLNSTAATVAAWRAGTPNDPAAAFSADTTSGDEDLLVAFTDESTGTGINFWGWDFGDSGTSNLQSPSHLYTEPGTYTVALTVMGSAGSDVETKTDYIVVHDVHTGSATVRNGSGVNPSIFTSTSVPTLTEDWTTEVDGGSIGAGGFIFVFVYAGSLPGTPTVYGELLLDPSSAWLFTDLDIAVGGISHHAITMPADPAYAGSEASAQAYLNSVAPSGLLTNAIDIELGG